MSEVKKKYKDRITGEVITSKRKYEEEKPISYMFKKNGFPANYEVTLEYENIDRVFKVNYGDKSKEEVMDILKDSYKNTKSISIKKI